MHWNPGFESQPNLLQIETMGSRSATSKCFRKSIMSKTILIADDEERMRSLLRNYLSQEGYRVLTAGNGREALLLARREKPDVVLLDVMMPEMDGFEFCASIAPRTQTGPSSSSRPGWTTPTPCWGWNWVPTTMSPSRSARACWCGPGAGHAAPGRPTGTTASVLRAADVTLDRSTRQVTVGRAPGGPDPFRVRPALDPDVCARPGLYPQ
jgi:hypothetical protein